MILAVCLSVFDYMYKYILILIQIISSNGDGDGRFLLKLHREMPALHSSCLPDQGSGYAALLNSAFGVNNLKKKNLDRRAQMPEH